MLSQAASAWVSALGVLVQLLVHCIVGAKQFHFLLPANVCVRDDVAKAHFLFGSTGRRAVASRSRMAGRHDRTDR
jgi:DNA-binding helix-hairpin-helix protein with protein kinase domain